MPFFRFIIDRPWPCLTAAILVSVAAFSGLFDLRLNNSMEAWLLEDDPTLRSYERFRDEFENDEYIIIGYRPVDSDILSEESLDLAERLTTRFAEIENVLKVTSLTSVEEIRADGDVLDVGDMVRRPLGAAERKRVLEKLTNDSLYRGTIASADATVAAIALTIARVPAARHLEVRRALIEELETTVAREKGEFHISGQPVFDVELYRLMYGDQLTLIPIMGLVFMIVLGVLFRSLVGIALPTITVSLAVLWTFGLIGTVGSELSMISGILPIVLLAIGVADSVHLLTEYQEELGAGRVQREAIINSVNTVFIPCLFTSLTTALGFLGLLIVKVQPIRDFGIFASAGTLLAFVASFTVLPAVLSLLPAPRIRLHAADGDDDAAKRTLDRVFMVVKQHRYLVVLASLITLAIGMLGIPSVTPSANAYRFFKSDNPAIVATDFIEDHIGGVYTMEILLEARDTESAESLKRLDVLEDSRALQRLIVENKSVEQTLSPVDFVATMNRTMHGDAPEAFRLPDTREAVGQLLLMYELDRPDGDLYDYINFDMSLGRLTARTRMSEMGSRADVVAQTREAAAMLKSVKATPTGTMVLYSDVEHHMIIGLIRGFIASFLAVGAMMTLLLRSPRHGILAMIPGGLPIVFVVGLTGWLGIELGTMPAMMGNVALGIAVDNAIHMLNRYQKYRTQGFSPSQAIGTAVSVVGRPVMFTTIVLCVGFLILVFSDMTPNIKFGAFTALILFGSLVGSVVTLPATILVVEERFGSAASNDGNRA